MISFKFAAIVSAALIVAAIPAASWAGPGAPAGIDPFSVTIDEAAGTWSLNGTLLPMWLVNGVPTTLLPENVVAGDVLIYDTPTVDLPGAPLGCLSDVLRFWDDGGGITKTMQFFSGDIGGGSVFDIGLPNPIQNFNVSINENPGITVYAAGLNQYDVISDDGKCSCDYSPVPEPCSLALLGIGGIPLVIRRRKATRKLS